ncbi:hypothetical protein CC78DRAFT_576446 [Lojkania enalia]|uniref:Uncharacterized protein n=1 Tax=Lojkania enalia TaxID=147567 RepID=A0A9P4KEX1_9PLEO|nr:hypothetical protein CC78DRAFT_576446 [Didymosphaeria enalia]
MPFMQPTSVYRLAAFRPALSAATLARCQGRYASQDYGSGQGNPAGEKPQHQGKNPSEELEHPGPPPPKVGGAKSLSPDEKEPNKSQATSNTKSGGSGQSRSGGRSTRVKGAQPKILNENPPGEHDQSVREHNEEMDHRAERAHEQVSNKDAEKDKVPAGYWQGQGGVDRAP